MEGNTEKLNVLRKISECGVVAVVRADNKEQAIFISEACIKGGILGIEITFTVNDAVDIIKELTSIYSDNSNILIGAGTVKAEDSLSEDSRLLYYSKRIKEMYPNILYMSSTFRKVLSSTSNQLQGNMYVDGELYQSKVHHIDPIVDRVGGGDTFAAGVLCGILEGKPSQ